MEWAASLLRSQQTMQDLTEDRDPTSPLDMAEWDEGSSMTSGELASCGHLLMLLAGHDGVGRGLLHDLR